MEVGTSVVAEVILFVIEIEGRGGDSVYEEFYETSDDAILASAIDGRNNKPKETLALKLSDGTYILPPRFIRVSNKPSDEQIKSLKAKLLAGLTPAQELLVKKVI